MTRNLEQPNFLHIALAAALATALYSMVLVLTGVMLGMPVPPLGIAVQLGFAAAVYNALLAPMASWPLRRRPSGPPGHLPMNGEDHPLGTISRRAQA